MSVVILPASSSIMTAVLLVTRQPGGTRRARSSSVSRMLRSDGGVISAIFCSKMVSWRRRAAHAAPKLVWNAVFTQLSGRVGHPGAVLIACVAVVSVMPLPQRMTVPWFRRQLVLKAGSIDHEYILEPAGNDALSSRSRRGLASISLCPCRKSHGGECEMTSSKCNVGPKKGPCTCWDWVLHGSSLVAFQRRLPRPGYQLQLTRRPVAFNSRTNNGGVASL